MRALTLRAMSLVIAAALAAPLIADIRVRVSVKIVLNPDDGNPPADATEADVLWAHGRANEWLSGFGRGYQYDLVDPVLMVGGQGQHDAGPSQYFDIDHDDIAQRRQMESDAQENPTDFAWRFDAINIYVVNSGGAHCSTDPQDEIIILGPNTEHDRITWSHEIGHYFSLCHTQGCGCGCSNEDTSCDLFGDDQVADTLTDRSYFDQNGIAQRNYSANYADLPPSQQVQVDNVFANIMSYRYRLPPCSINFNDKNRFTEGQLDRWSNGANNHRRFVVTGDTIVADPAAVPFGNGSFFWPFDTVRGAHNAATNNGTDIILLRSGIYDRDTYPLLLNREVTLRAPRGASAISGL